MMKTFDPYRTRSIRFTGLREVGPWRMKVYHIVYEDSDVSPELAAAALEAAENILVDLEITDRTYGVGFIGIHQGKNANFVFVDWWADENELHHRLFLSDAERPDELRPQTPGGAVACVWDLYLINHERSAWVKYVLQPPDRPDIGAYLKSTLDAAV